MTDFNVLYSEKGCVFIIYISSDFDIKSYKTLVAINIAEFEEIKKRAF